MQPIAYVSGSAMELLRADKWASVTAAPPNERGPRSALYSAEQLAQAVTAERKRCAMMVYLIRLESELKDAPDHGTSGWLMEAEAAVLRSEGKSEHASDCAVHNEPAYPAGPCDCKTGSTK